VAITIVVADVASFVSDPAHPGVVSGAVHVEGLTPKGGSRIGGGSFHLFLDEGDPEARAMRYTLPFHDDEGGSWTLRGVKDVRGHRIVDFLRSTTTLDARLDPGEGTRASATGRLRISPRGVARLLLSTRSAGGLAAAWRFGRFYATTILRLYLAGKRAARR
jgi:cholesterol oxidase